MKTQFILLLSIAGSSVAALAQARAPKTTPPPPPPPPPVFIAPAEVSAPPPVQAPPPQFIYDQKPLAGRPYLVTPEQAQTIIDRFKEAYPKLGSPRMLIYINRELVDEDAGMKLSARSEQTEIVRGDVQRDFQADTRNGAAAPAPAQQPQVSGSVVLGNVNVNPFDSTPGKGKITGEVERATNKNTYRVRDRKQLTLADRQTARDVERLFGRPLRLGGVSIVDQRIATQMIPDKQLKSLIVQTEGEQARKDREALTKIADVVLEILVSSRQISVPELSGTKVYTIPDIQATAIRLSDSKIIGQATSADLIGDDRYAGRVARTFTVREITEATALSLMEDLLQ